MLAYDYLKDNPQVRHKQVTQGWASLFTDSDVPLAIKKELIELNSYTSNITDALLFWHQQWVMLTVVQSVYLLPINWSLIVKTQWLERLYSVYQQEEDDDCKKDLVNKGLTILTSLYENNPCFTYDLSFEETSILCRAFNRNNSLATNVIYAIRRHKRGLARSYRSSDNDSMLLKACSKNLIASCSDIQLQLISDLLRDVTHEEGRVFTSIRSIQRAHDERTEIETKMLLETCDGSRYVYTDEFTRIVTKHGFFLPTGPSSLLKRGQQHHNCVGRYHDTHMSDGTRLIFSKVGTIEITFERSLGVIVATEIKQYRGKHNKEIPVTEDLVSLRLELTGQPWSILSIEESKE